MKILQAHNKYMSGSGGEDTVLEEERLMLAKQGHEVHQWFVNSAGLISASPLRKIAVGIGFIWSLSTYLTAKRLLHDLKPDIMHVHNFFPLLSPSILWAAKSVGVPVVMTLHNYRLICPNSNLLRDSTPCELCVGHLPFSALKHGCKYGDSSAVAMSIAMMQVANRLIKTFHTKVNAFIALTEFAKSVNMRSGLPADRIFVKPNFVSSPISKGLSARKQQVVFVGHISAAKGIDLLIDAWLDIMPEGWKLVIAGDGPDRYGLSKLARGVDSVSWLGKVSRDAARQLVSESRYLVLPSRLYEGFPMAVLEAFASGVPVITPNHGPFPSIVEENVSGWLFNPSDVDDLKEKLNSALCLSNDAWLALSKLARDQYTTKYTAEENYKQLMSIYESAINSGKNIF